MKHPIGILTFLLLVWIGCSDGESASDAYGTFEASETTISSHATGTLVLFRAREGDRLAAGEIVAVVDTTQLDLQRAALHAQRGAARSRAAGVRAQLEILAERRRIARREERRFQNLVQQDAAARKQLDEVRDEVRVLDREVVAVETQLSSLENEIDAINAQVAQVADQIARSVVVNPVDGTVLTSFAEQHELAVSGKPLYTIADLETLVLKAYVSGGQLASVRLGSPVEVLTDSAAGALRRYRGTIARLASEAEFTPRFIQTRDERVDLVYAMDVRVPNSDGSLKIGMPGEVRFSDGQADE